MPRDFSSFLKNRLVQHTIREGAPSIGKVELKPGERREISVLFLDLGGFTALSERLDHEAVHDISKGVMDALVDITENYGGYVDKIEGDRIMVLFGAIKAGENDSERAVSCGLLMQSAIGAANDILEDTGVPITARIGINSGPVTVAPDAIGHLTAIGRTVNLASRMEEAAPEGTILVPESVRSRCGELFCWEDAGLVHLKGISEPVHAYRPVSCLSYSRPRWERLSKVCFDGFVGRQEELSRLMEMVRLQQSGSTGSSRLGGPRHLAVQVRGEAGIGKSRLVHEFLRGLAGSDESFLVLKGQTRSYAQPAYHLWTTLLRNLLDLQPDERPDYEDFRRMVLDLSRGSELEDSIPFLAELLAIRSGDRRLDELDSGAIALETRIAFRNLLKTVSSHRNLLVILDDLHWIDSTCQGVLEFVLGNCASKRPILFILITRNERDDGRPVSFDIKQGYAIMEELVLHAMDRNDCHGIISSMLGQISGSDNASVGSRAEGFLLEHSRGNPFFLEELILDMVESGLMVLSEEEWSLSRAVEDIYVPPSLTGLLQSRLDRLPDDQRGSLQKSSVLGFEFRLRLYRSLLEQLGLEEDTESVFDSLEQRQFLLEKSAVRDKTFEFRHVLIHDTVYSTILDSNKRLLHRLTASLIEETVSDDGKEMADILTHHWERAGDREKAIHWGVINLSHTVATYQHERALELSGKLEGWIREKPLNSESAGKLIEVLMGRYGTLDLTGRRRDQEELLREMKQLADEYEVLDWQPRILSSLGSIYRITGRMEEAEECYNEALEMASDMAEGEYQSKVLCNLGILSRVRGDLRKSKEYFLEALEKNRDADNPGVEGVILGNLGNLYFDHGDMDRAIEYYRKAMELNREVGDRRSEGIALGNLGNPYMSMGDLEQALKYYSQSLELHREIGNRRSEGVTLSNLGALYYDHGRFEESLDCNRKALEIHREIGNRRMEAITLASMASLSMRSGSVSESLALYLEALGIIDDLGLSESGFDRLAELRTELISSGHSHEQVPWPSRWTAPEGAD